MDIQFAKYKELIEQQLEELTAEDVLGQSAQKTAAVGRKAFAHGRVAIPSDGASTAETRINRRCKRRCADCQKTSLVIVWSAEKRLRRRGC